MSTSPSGNSGKRSRVCAMTPKATGAPDRRRLGTRRGMGRISRRELIVSGALAAGALAGSPRLLREALAAPARAGAGPYGPLGPPDANGLMLPPGFSSREIARGLSHVAGYPWPIFPDGQATFATRDGGWVLVTNSESLAVTGAGTSAIRFRPDGGIAAAYRILGGTNANCAGGPTPWGTWLSCEEHASGLVWECDPAGRLPALARPALGVFNHEAAAVEPAGRQLYLTEDEGDGGFYRFTPSAYPDVSEGLLEVAVVASDSTVSWREVPNPTPTPLETPTRQQVPEMTRFNGGEGIWHDGGVLYFTRKGDRRLWAYDARTGMLEVVFDHAATPDASLDAVDNVTVSAAGEIFVCEDGGNMEMALITPEREGAGGRVRDQRAVPAAGRRGARAVRAAGRRTPRRAAGKRRVATADAGAATGEAGLSAAARPFGRGDSARRRRGLGRSRHRGSAAKPRPERDGRPASHCGAGSAQVPRDAPDAAAAAEARPQGAAPAAPPPSAAYRPPAGDGAAGERPQADRGAPRSRDGLSCVHLEGAHARRGPASKTRPAQPGRPGRPGGPQ